MTEEKDPHSSGKDSRPRNNGLWLSTLGINLVLAGAVGVVIGHFLDTWFKTQPVLTIAFFLLGTFAGFLQMYKEVQRLSKEEENRDDAKK